MQTPYDFITLALFSGLIVLFLQRSTGDSARQDSLLHYLVAAVLCAVINYLGNNHDDALAILLLIANLAFIVLVLKPFNLRLFR